MVKDIAALMARIAAVQKQSDVYFADLAAVQKPVAADVVSATVVDEKSARPAREKAIDGVAWHVFNTLRGTDDLVPTAFSTEIVDGVSTQVPIEWATFDDVRALVAESF